jgi:hypothetical protein
MPHTTALQMAADFEKKTAYQPLCAISIGEYCELSQKGVNSIHNIGTVSMPIRSFE